MDNICRNTKLCTTNKKHKSLFDFDDMIANKLSYYKLKPVVTELFTEN